VTDTPSETGAGSAPGFDSKKTKAHEQVADSWPLEADRMAIQDPLVDCLRILAGFYGRRTSRASLTAGLPVPPTGITPILFTRAAERADLHARLAEKSLEALAIAPNLPCILVLNGKQACILWEVREPGRTGKKGKDAAQDRKLHPETEFLVQFPETEDEKQALRLSDLKKLYNDYAFFIRPVARTDERAGPAEIETGREWFWSALWENRKIYSEVILAAVMINLFAIGSSLFVMNVYDRVIPNNAYETLWVLSVGVCTVYIFDFILKNLRAHFLDHAGKKADVKISARLFQQMMGMTMASRPASAGVMASHMREFESLRDFFTSATMTVLIDLPFVALFILLIAVIGGPVAFVPLVAVPIVIAIGFMMQKPLERVTKQSMMESALKNALLFETITGLETIKVQAAEGHTQRNWEELTEKSARTNAKSKQINRSRACSWSWWAYS
jgi:ATP-binding cassette, subfamily C, bacterial LapB